MRKIALLLALLALVASQEVIVENWTGQYETGQQVSKEFRNPAWNSVLDFAVYGWYKINSALPSKKLSTIFHLTQNDKNFGFSKNIGDRKLALFTVSNILRSSSYDRNNIDINSDVLFKDSDRDKWVFFYVAYGSEQQRRYSYFELPSGTKQDIIQTAGHYVSEFYRIYIGQSGTYKYFPGSLAKVTLHGGSGSYRESNFSQLQNYNPNIPAPPIPVIPPVPDTGIVPTPPSAAPSTPPTPVIPSTPSEPVTNPTPLASPETPQTPPVPGIPPTPTSSIPSDPSIPETTPTPPGPETTPIPSAPEIPQTPAAPVIPPTPKCPQIYTECGYNGIPIDLCESQPNYDVKSIKSILIPPNYTVTVHDLINYAGKKVTYNTSIECITEFNWSFLVDSHAITIRQEKTHLKRNSHKRH